MEMRPRIIDGNGLIARNATSPIRSVEVVTVADVPFEDYLGADVEALRSIDQNRVLGGQIHSRNILACEEDTVLSRL